MSGTKNPKHMAGHKKRIKTVIKPDRNRKLEGTNGGH
jgi:hypothetical protein